MAFREMKEDEQVLHDHPEAGQFYVKRFGGVEGNHYPKGMPFFCAGRFYASEQEAVDGFHAAWNESEKALADNSYTRMEARTISPGVFEED